MIIATKDLIIKTIKAAIEFSGGCLLNDNSNDIPVINFTHFAIVKKDGDLYVCGIPSEVGTKQLNSIYLSSTNLPRVSTKTVKLFTNTGSIEESVEKFNESNKYDEWSPCEIIEVFEA